MKLLKQSMWSGIVWIAVIFYLLSMDTSGANEFSLMKVYGIDKLIHFVLFAILTFLWGAYFFGRETGHGNQIVWLIIILASTYGMGMEYYQKYCTTRSFSYWDGLFDALGSAVGALVAKKSPYGNRGRNQN